MNSFQKIHSWLMKPRGEDPAEEALRRLRDAKPGELVELPRGITLEFRSFDKDQRKSIEERSNTQNIKHIAEHIRAPRSPGHDIIRPAKAFPHCEAEVRMINELTKTKQDETKRTDKPGTKIRNYRRNPNQSTDSNNCFIPSIKQLKDKKRIHLITPISASTRCDTGVSALKSQELSEFSSRNPFIPLKPMRGCQIPSGCQCSNREMAMRCNYWDRREAEHDKHLNDLLRITPYIGMLWMSLCLGGIFAIVGAIGLLVLERMP